MATSDFEDASFEQYVKAEIEKREAVIAERDTEIESLKRQIAELKKQKGISSVRDGLTFSDHTGLWSDQAGLLYCSTCLGEDKRNPMKSELPHGWRCSAVPRHYFSNPDSPPQAMRIEGGGGGGPQSWMGG